MRGDTAASGEADEEAPGKPIAVDLQRRTHRCHQVLATRRTSLLWQANQTVLTKGQYAPYFVGIFGWFENDESIFIAMEYLPAGDLEQYRVDSGRFSESDTSCIVRQLVHGVRHMHENGFTHRDLKPGVSHGDMLELGVR
jgi:serine/threonine protein kinase